MRVIFTKEGEESLISILEFLHYKWSEKEIDVMFSEIEEVVKKVEEGTVKFPKFYKELQFALVGNNQVKMIFHHQGDLIKVLYLHQGKQNPENLNFLKK